MRTECPDCGHDDHFVSDGGEGGPYLVHCPVIWMGERCDCGADNRPDIERYGTLEHEWWLIEMERQEG